ncbi:MAG TPA: Rieske 2Fe-2S domain-containing protein [Candidatus Polarisedimenticolia bacterium]|nr:Rieske 2Fe-2S domain-containing protein [Candidatus Polarisedimenticolia bacterium]
MTDEGKVTPLGVPQAGAAAALPASAAVKAPAAAKGATGAAAPAAEMSRRGFLSTLGIAWTTFAAACGAGAIATSRFMFPNVLFEPPQTFKAGFPAEFLPDTVDNRFKEAFGVFIVREQEGIYALKAVCTHLGCTPNWLEAENKFKCPCHGSGFYRSGINYEGPAPRPLERYRIVLTDDGQILIDKTKSFAYEKGEWGSPEAELKV